MNGIAETKGIILQNLDTRLKQLEQCGCPKGEVREEKIHNMNNNMDYLRKTMTEVNSKLFWGLLLLSIMSFFAGVNMWQEILKTFAK